MVSGLLLTLCFSVVAAGVVRQQFGMPVQQSYADVMDTISSGNAHRPVGHAPANVYYSNAAQTQERHNPLFVYSQPPDSDTPADYQQPAMSHHVHVARHPASHLHTKPLATSNYHKSMPSVHSAHIRTPTKPVIDHDISGADADDHNDKQHTVNHHHENGETHKQQQRRKSGHHNSESYAKTDEFDAGETGSHDHKEDAKHHSAAKEQQGSRESAANNHQSHADDVLGIKGGQYAEKKQHKKGSKTAGYHNVFHKDEYKKDHIFYDDADHSGDFEKYGHVREQHAQDEGDVVKGGHNASGMHAMDQGKKGHLDNGHHEQRDMGYTKKHGNNRHQAQDTNYAMKGHSAGINKHRHAGEHH